METTWGWVCNDCHEPTTVRLNVLTVEGIHHLSLCCNARVHAAKVPVIQPPKQS